VEKGDGKWVKVDIHTSFGRHRHAGAAQVYKLLFSLFIKFRQIASIIYSFDSMAIFRHFVSFSSQYRKHVAALPCET